MAILTGGTIPALVPGKLAHVFFAPGLTADITSAPALANIDAVLVQGGLTVTDRQLVSPLELRSFASSVGTGISMAGDMHVSVPQPDPSTGILLLKTDVQTGAHEWVFPNPDVPPISVKTMAAAVAPAQPAGGKILNFTVRLSSVSRPLAASDLGATTLSLLGTIGKFVIRTIAYAIPKSWLGAGINAIARDWESAHRKYELLKVSVTGNEVTTRPMAVVDIKALGNSRSLLFLHGTFSTFQAGFGDLKAAGMGPLLAKYGTVWALNHPTMADGVTDNLQWFFNALQDQGVGPLKIDIVSHSRGGLLARGLTAQGAAAPVPLDISKAVLAASPNQGTPMADAAHMRDVVNVWTNIVDLAAGGTVAIVVDAIMFLVTAIGYTGLQSLKGLADMAPNSPFLTSILQKTRCPSTYFAIAADLEEPLGAAVKTPLLWTAYEADQQVFSNTLNDLVVPYTGSYICSGDVNFPVVGPQLRQFANSQSVFHTNLFAQPETIESLNTWL